MFSGQNAENLTVKTVSGVLNATKQTGTSINVARLYEGGPCFEFC